MISAKTSAAVPEADIPYRHESADLTGSAASALLVTVALLAGCVAVLWYAKKHGWLSKWISPASARSAVGGMELVQSLRLSPKSTLHKVRDGQRSLLVLESTVQASVMTGNGDDHHEQN